MRAEVVDVDVFEAGPKHAKAWVAYQCPEEPGLRRCKVGFLLGSGAFLLDGDLPLALLEEVEADCSEACLYQRDLNREMN